MGNASRKYQNTNINKFVYPLSIRNSPVCISECVENKIKLRSCDYIGENRYDTSLIRHLSKTWIDDAYMDFWRTNIGRLFVNGNFDNLQITPEKYEVINDKYTTYRSDRQWCTITGTLDGEMNVSGFVGNGQSLPKTTICNTKTPKHFRLTISAIYNLDNLNFLAVVIGHHTLTFNLDLEGVEKEVVVITEDDYDPTHYSNDNWFLTEETRCGKSTTGCLLIR
jgi:hypothetical protein